MRVHVAVVDLFPPSPFDPGGMNGEIRRDLAEVCDEENGVSDAEPLSLASYVAGPVIEIYSEELAVGAVLPETPLFLSPERYVSLPLESTYLSAYQGMPAFWRDVLEGKGASVS
jgi:hypothetical protein